jgi:glycosyltransferase involved in cell wall biosynthesis
LRPGCQPPARTVTSLPEQAGDAALIFDPLGRERRSLAPFGRLWQDEDLRRELVEKGRARVAELSWERTARIFRAHYRRLAGAGMTDEDHALLASPAKL